MKIKSVVAITLPRLARRRFWSILGSVIAGLMGLLLSSCIFVGWEQALCQFFGSCTGVTSTYRGFNAEKNKLAAYYLFGETGTFTPTNDTAAGPADAAFPAFAPRAESQSLLNELSENGYLAIRVPHVPPTYTASSIVTPTYIFYYYKPPSSTTSSSVSISFVRRAEYEPAVNAAFPIADGRSHWEVWWLPDGEQFPSPEKPFRLEGTAHRFEYDIDFGPGTQATDCAGCTLEYRIWNGYVYYGPFEHQINLGFGPSWGDPLVTFDQCPPPSTPTMLERLQPGEPLAHEHCLRNEDVISHTYALSITSSMNWSYDVYTRANQASATPVPLVGDQITLEPSESLNILAVVTPTVTISDTFREAFTVVATSQSDPSATAQATSMAFAPAYQLNELVYDYAVYLPLVTKADEP